MYTVTGDRPSSPAPAAPLLAALYQMQSLLPELHDRLDALANRLHPVLRPEPPACDSINSHDRVEDSPRCHLVEELEASAESIKIAVEKINNLGNRLEV